MGAKRSYLNLYQQMPRRSCIIYTFLFMSVFVVFWGGGARGALHFVILFIFVIKRKEKKTPSMFRLWVEGNINRCFT